MISRDSRQKTPEKTNQIKFLHIDNFQKEKPTICTTILTLSYIIVEKFSGAHHSNNNNNKRFEGRFFHLELLLLLLVCSCQCPLVVATHLFHFSALFTYCCCKKECEIGALSGYDQVSSISRGWQVSLSRRRHHHYHLNLFRRCSRLLFPSTPPFSSSFFLIINQDRFD